MWSPGSLFGHETLLLPIHHSNKKMSRRKHVLEVRHDQQKFQKIGDRNRRQHNKPLFM
jgi:hypothetical protein